MVKTYKSCKKCKLFESGCGLSPSFRKTCLENDYLYFEPKSVKEYLEFLAAEVEPKTHCCECTPGPHFQVHMVHIQYPDCGCDPKNYVLRRNNIE